MTTTTAPMTIDLRSDTVTRPTAAMREAIARAPVGDDVFGDDPSVNLLERVSAALLGKEAAVFVPSGTAANQIALLVHCRPGEEVVVGEGAHQMCFEGGGGGALAGVQFAVAGRDGFFTAADVDGAIHPDDPHYPRTRLVSLEDTHNRSGGRVWPFGQLRAVADAARRHGLALHLDGARLLNAATASGMTAAERAAPFDTVSLCFSKGLGAPVGSVIAGTRELMRSARRYRKMLGGGMRQAGVVAAAALYALEHHVNRLTDDHANARRLASRLTQGGLRVLQPETNIVLIDLPEGGATSADLVARARERGVLLVAMGPRRLRAVTHLDVDDGACDRAAQLLLEVLPRA